MLRISVNRVSLKSVLAVWQACRPNFLLLSLSMPLAAAALSYHQGNRLNLELLLVLLLVVLIAHAAVNLRNEIDDTESGLDEVTVKTPFSGGSGALLNFNDAVSLAKGVFKVQLVLLLGFGLYFAWSVTAWLIPLGMTGLLLIHFYTTHLTRFPLVYWMSAGLGFGLIMLLGSYWVLANDLNLEALLFALICFFWVNNLLLLNQLPDLEADRTVGRLNVWMVYGRQTGFALFMISAILSLLLLAAMALQLENSLLFAATLWGLPMLWMALGLKKWLGRAPLMQITPENLRILRPILAMNVIINLFFPLCIALILVI